MCSVFDNKLLLFNSGGYPKAMTIACITLEASVGSLANNSWNPVLSTISATLRKKVKEGESQCVDNGYFRQTETLAKLKEPNEPKVGSSSSPKQLFFSSATFLFIVFSNYSVLYF